MAPSSLEVSTKLEVSPHYIRFVARERLVSRNTQASLERRQAPRVCGFGVLFCMSASLALYFIYNNHIASMRSRVVVRVATTY